MEAEAMGSAMIGVYTSENLDIALSLHSAPLAGIEERTVDWLLGTVKISKRHAHFSVGYGGTLTPESRFRKVWFDSPDTGKRGWAVIFRSLDRGSTTTAPEEFFAGWVPPEREPQADEWIAFLNSEIQKRLAGT